jgi:predicted Fe-Mo cluster-binding NifX family protein
MQESNIMKLCIPVQTDNGRRSEVYGHFGSAPFFMLYDSADNTFTCVDNSGSHHEHGACHPVAALGNHKVDAVICGGMGMRAIEKLNGAGIKVLRASAMTVEQAVEQFNAGECEELTIQDACTDHNCH